MTTRYVAVPSAAIRDRLVAAGFKLVSSVGEEVYERTHDKSPEYRVKVYSSVRGSTVRKNGADAIRVVALLNGNNGTVYPIFKGKRVYRTGSVEAVLERMIERAREAYARCNEHRKGLKKTDARGSSNPNE